MIEIPFSESDQRRLEISGGKIVIKPNGLPISRFDSKEKFNLFVALGKIQKDKSLERGK